MPVMDETTPCSPLDLRIRVFLIHHDVSERVEAVRPTVDVVVDALRPFGKVEATEVRRQPPFAPPATRVVAARYVRQWRLERRWAAYLGVGRRWFLSTGLLALRLIQLITSSSHGAAAKRRAFIELALTSKHELIWKLAAEDGIDLMLVLEDDARALAESIERIRTVVKLAAEEGCLSDVYVDLAGGVSRRAIRLDRFTETYTDGIVTVRRPGTTTACAYLAGSSVINLLADMAVLDPSASRLPADWLINQAFMSNRQQVPSLTCWHADPPLIAHGSTTGIVKSSIRG